MPHDILMYKIQGNHFLLNLVPGSSAPDTCSSCTRGGSTSCRPCASPASSADRGRGRVRARGEYHGRGELRGGALMAVQ